MESAGGVAPFVRAAPVCRVAQSFAWCEREGSYRAASRTAAGRRHRESGGSDLAAEGHILVERFRPGTDSADGRPLRLGLEAIRHQGEFGAQSAAGEKSCALEYCDPSLIH